MKPPLLKSLIAGDEWARFSRVLAQTILVPKSGDLHLLEFANLNAIQHSTAGRQGNYHDYGRRERGSVQRAGSTYVRVAKNSSVKLIMHREFINARAARTMIIEDEFVNLPVIITIENAAVLATVILA